MPDPTGLSAGGKSEWTEEKIGMMNIGVRPTVGGLNRVNEVNIFDFDGDLYGKTLRIYVHAFLRPEQKFSGLEELKTQLGKDREAAMKLVFRS
jgi:riboflavin kinase/FMN adenylyltransferase